MGNNPATAVCITHVLSVGATCMAVICFTTAVTIKIRTGFFDRLPFTLAFVDIFKIVILSFKLL